MESCSRWPDNRRTRGACAVGHKSKREADLPLLGLSLRRGLVGNCPGVGRLHAVGTEVQLPGTVVPLGLPARDCQGEYEYRHLHTHMRYRSLGRYQCACNQGHKSW